MNLAGIISWLLEIRVWTVEMASKIISNYNRFWNFDGRILNMNTGRDIGVQVLDIGF